MGSARIITHLYNKVRIEEKLIVSQWVKRRAYKARGSLIVIGRSTTIIIFIGTYTIYTFILINNN